MDTGQDHDVHSHHIGLTIPHLEMFIGGPEKVIPEVLRYLCEPSNLKLIEHECGESKRSSSNTLKTFLTSTFPDHSDGFRSKTTSHTTLRYLLMKELTPSNFPGGVSEDMLCMMDNVSDIIRAHYHSSPMTERQAYSDFRIRVIKSNFGMDYVNDIKKSLRFTQSDKAKSMADKLQVGSRDGRIMNQTNIDFDRAVDLGRSLVSMSRRIMFDLANDDDDCHEYRMNVLLATVMYSTGCRLVEVLLVSDFIYTEPPSGYPVRPGSSCVCISPVAKLRSNSKSKYSIRPVLFGMDHDEVVNMVDMIRFYLREANPVYQKLNKDVAGDRRYVVRITRGYSKYVPDLLSGLSKGHAFTPRDFRGLYVSMSYKMWAKHPTSEIMWINKTLDHGSVDTSLSYNKFKLVEKFTNTKYDTRYDKYESRLRLLESALAKINGGDKKSQEEE
jgi:hypothetical protein